MKARLTAQIHRIIRERGMTQTEAAAVLGVKQPHVSWLMNNRAGSFSVGRLLEFLTRLGQDVGPSACKASFGEITGLRTDDLKAATMRQSASF